MVYFMAGYLSRLLSEHMRLKWLIVEPIVRVEWMWRNMFNVGGSSTGSEGIGKYLKRQKGEGVETENICDVKKLQWQRSRGDLKRTRNIQVNMSTRDLVCIVTHWLTLTLYLSRQPSLEYHWDYFLYFEQQQRSSAHWHGFSLINHGDASDSEDLDE